MVSSGEIINLDIQLTVQRNCGSMHAAPTRDACCRALVFIRLHVLLASEGARVSA